MFSPCLSKKSSTSCDRWAEIWFEFVVQNK
jgi:hypothetical protein